MDPPPLIHLIHSHMITNLHSLAYGWLTTCILTFMDVMTLRCGNELPTHAFMFYYAVYQLQSYALHEFIKDYYGQLKGPVP